MIVRIHLASTAALLALALAGCGRSESPQAAAGAVEMHTARSDREAAADRATAIRDADARGKQRADAAVDRLAAEEKQRVDAR